MATPSQYLESHHVSFYMEDCIAQLLLYREDNPKVNARNFMAEYFKCLNSGNHVMLREFAFITATPHNRLSFVRLIYRAYCNLNEVGDCLSLRELHALLLLLCPDLPWHLVERAGATAHATCTELGGAAGGSNSVPPAAAVALSDLARDARFLFSDFLMAFQVHFLYDEFLGKCSQVYESLLSGGNRSNIDVFLPTDQMQPQATSKEASEASAESTHQRVSSSVYLRLIEGVCQELQLHVPNVDIIRKSMGTNRTVTYREFISGLVRSKELSAALATQSVGAQSADMLAFSPLRASSIARAAASMAPRPSTVVFSVSQQPQQQQSPQQQQQQQVTNQLPLSSPSRSRAPAGNKTQQQQQPKSQAATKPSQSGSSRAAAGVARRARRSSSSSAGDSSTGSGVSSGSSSGTNSDSV